MTTRLLHWSQPFLFIALFALVIACQEDDKPKTEPVLTTAAVADVTTTTATGGGEITDNGNADVIVSGLVYSSTNALPALTDSKTELTVTEGAFTSKLENLSSGTTYHVRAYATNSIGTGYGDVVDFVTGNAAPVASNITIAGTLEVNKPLTATYTYSDAENNAESGSTIQWYIADDAGGTGEVAISGATSLTYTPLDVHEFKYIRIGITPKAATGNTAGIQVKSIFTGPIAVRTTVTFTYNGAAVTYGILTSSVTGRKWLDRNLGAPNTPTAYNDFANYGDLFQWGRGADGHQLITRNGNSSGQTTGVTTTATLSITDSPGHASFILNPSIDPYDWRSPSNDNLWQGVNGINNPCPSGWRIPTYNEWVAESITSVETGYTQIKITLGGQRSGETGLISTVPTQGQYWSSTTYPNPAFVGYELGDQFVSTASRGKANSCRCIKN